MIMACSNCYYKEYLCTYKEKHNLSEDIFDFCLVRVPPNNRKNFVHHEFPNLKRNNGSYKYLKWKPRNKEMLLTDEDIKL